MLKEQESLPLSPYYSLYDEIIEEDNELRRLNNLVDFEFIYEELKKNYCLDNGRGAICPIRMFKYLLLKRMYKLSDEDVVKRSKYDMSFKYFLEMAPEDPVINPSSLTYFRKLRLKDINLLDLLIEQTTKIAIEHGLIEMEAALIVDSTHSNSRYRPVSVAKYLQEQAKKLRKVIYDYDETMKEKFPEKPTDYDAEEYAIYCEELIKIIGEAKGIRDIPAVKEKMNYLKEVVEDCKESVEVSEDRDARTGHKSEDISFFGYKTSIGMTTERLIVAAIVTSGEKNDGKYLEDLVNKSEQSGLKVKTVIGDTAYSGKDNLILAKEKGFQLVSKLHPILTNERKNTGFEFNKDADLYVCPAGHLATGKRIHRRKDRNTEIQYRFDIEKCKVCPLRDGCYKEGAKSKTFTVTLKSTEHQEQQAFQETETFQELSRERYMIEAKNSELKNRHGYDRATDSGLFGMEIQAAATIFVVNMKRIMKLIDQK